VKTHTWTNAPEYAKDALAGFVATLSKDRDVEIREVTLPEGMERAHTVHETIYNKALSYYFKGEYKQSDFVSPVMSVLIESGNKISVEEYRRAIADQMELIYAMDDFFADHDVIISLSTAGEAPPREIVELPDPALMWTLTHLPVVSVPKFLSPQGLPFGFQVAARKYNDYLLFDFLDHLAMNGSIPERAGYAIDCEGAGG
jgi:Asp-tRNA(Asn)/Glu-tRNA(Gln) amidotransferase A subunit family amidase